MAGMLLKKDGISFTFETRLEGNWEDCGLDAMVFLFLHYQNELQDSLAGGGKETVN
jgi:hypothetical protein